MKKSNIIKKLTFFTLSGTLLLSSSAFARGGPGGRHNPDTDGDGVVSQTEFLSVAEERFNARDTDGDGVITRDEILGDAASHFTEMDTNQDGVLSQDEMRSHHRGPRPEPTQQ